MINRFPSKTIIMIILFSIIFSSMSVRSQEGTDEPAEIVASVDVPNNRIPSIDISDWTVINITVLDKYGINWTLLSTRFPIRAQYIWPIIHPSWKPFLGYSSLRFDTEIVEGNPRGWYAKITPSAIPSADQNKKYDLKLEVKTDDIAVDYAVVVGIKVTRVNVFGIDSGVSYIYVPVKASSLNNIKMETVVTSKEVAPFSYAYFDLNIKNYGYYRDMFSLEFKIENELIVESTKQIFVLEPEESDSIRISILTPEKFYDIGTPNKIEIYAKSSNDQTKTLIGTVVVITKGVYISPLSIIIATPIILLLVVIYLIFFYFRYNLIGNNKNKPDKPWNIPIEQKYLKELKEKNKEEYVKTIDMMKDEYKSSLLWYKDNIKHKKSEKSNKSNSTEVIKNFFNNRKNNIKDIGKQKEKKVKGESKIKKTEEEQNKKEKNQYRKLFSNIPKRLRLKKEKNQIDQNIIEDEVNDKPIATTEKIQKSNVIDRTEEEKKIERSKYLEIKKNKEKEKAITKIKKLQDRQRKKIKK